MKLGYIFLFSSIVLLFSSCKKEEEPELVNTWKLIEMLADPGDGSGTFQPVASDKLVQFYANGTVTSNGFLCQMGTESNSGSSGTYSEAEMSLTPNNCGIAPFVIYYEFEGANLILNYPCIEACRERYELQ
tara:strand:- start:125 stop:517 length:393 start_codon:yes stop_codon:yes gene_type:complete